MNHAVPFVRTRRPLSIAWSMLALLISLCSGPPSVLAGDQPESMQPWTGAWKMFGPIASEKDPGLYRPWFEPRYQPLPLDGATSVPAQLSIDGRTETAREYLYEGQAVDFQQLWHLNPGQGIVYLMRPLEMGADGIVPVLCRAQGWVTWWVNGETVYAGGDDGGEVTDHSIDLPLRAGSNLVVMRLAAGKRGWGMQLLRDANAGLFPQLQPAQAVDWNAAAGRWSGDGFVECATHDQRLRLMAAPGIAGRLALGGSESLPPDRLARVRFKPLVATGRPAELFIQLKDGVQVGFIGFQHAATREYQVIWQIRDHGRVVWEVDHRPTSDWAGVSPLADFRQSQASLELSRMDLDGLSGRAREREEFEYILATRGDEVTLRVDGMDGLVLRHGIAGSATRGGALGLAMKGMAVEIASFTVEPLPDEMKSRWAMGDDPPVRWAGPRPNPRLPAAGYPVMEGLSPITVYRATPEAWTFNHHPKIAHFNGRYFASWSNSYMHEDSAGTRVRGVVSNNGRDWSPSFVMLPSIGEPAVEFGNPKVPGVAIWPEELGGFRAVEDRVYVLGRAGYRGGYMGQGGNMGILARRVDAPDQMGPIFWLAEKVPVGGEAYPGINQLGSEQLRSDALILLEQLRLPADFAQKSIYPRDNYRGPKPEAADYSIISHDPIYTCPDGMQVRVWRNYNGTHRVYVSTRRADNEAWSYGVPTNISDSPSGVAVGELPDRRVFLLGNQVSGDLDDPDARPYRDPRKSWPFPEREFQPEHFPRDPLVLALSRDGRVFDRVWAVRHDTPDARYGGLGWLPGFQYPDAVVTDEALWVIYSVNKEDVEILPIPLDRLRVPE